MVIEEPSDSDTQEETITHSEAEVLENQGELLLEVEEGPERKPLLDRTLSDFEEAEFEPDPEEEAAAVNQELDRMPDRFDDMDIEALRAEIRAQQQQQPGRQGGGEGRVLMKISD